MASSSFTASLSRGIHAAAQPLAILRARFYPDLVRHMKKNELVELAMSSTVQIERLCTLFGYLQELVTAESIVPRLAETAVAALLRDAVEGVELWFQDAGISLTSSGGNGTTSVLADRQRTLQAMSTILMIAHSHSANGDSVKVTAGSTGNGVEITVGNPNSNPSTLSAEASLGLAVAEAHMQSQNGGFSYSLSPLLVRLTLPTAF